MQGSYFNIVFDFLKHRRNCEGEIYQSKKGIWVPGGSGVGMISRVKIQQDLEEHQASPCLGGAVLDRWPLGRLA